MCRTAMFFFLAMLLIGIGAALVDIGRDVRDIRNGLIEKAIH